MGQPGLTRVVALLLFFLQACPAGAAIVRAEDYSSFWVWGGVRRQAVLTEAENLYILQGRIVEERKPGGARTVIIAQGMDIPRLARGRVWLVYRADVLRWTPTVISAIVSRLNQWKRSGNPVVGLQIDFDAKTRHLHEYAAFLKEVRGRLPESFLLSITGLLDWSSTGDTRTINKLAGTVDEIVIQTYQGRKTVANYRAYLPALNRLTVPFRIGVVQHGEWEAPKNLESNPWFKGYVVFLRNLT